MKILALILTLTASFSVLAQWQLNNNLSSLSFVSVKKGEIAEAHQFKELSGWLNDKGMAKVSIDLSSVSTGIEIRDQRLVTMFFDAEQYPEAIFSATIAPEFIENLSVGTSQSYPLVGELSLRGEQKVFTIDTIVSRIADRKIIVSSVKPVIMQVSDFGLTSGLAKLAEVAQLPSITGAVPVSFVLSFEHK
jgi:polyisoprenoid-binding protein YceI